MATFSPILLAFLFIMPMLNSLHSIDAIGDHHHLKWVPTRPRCQGSMAECMAENKEFEMDSEINRRILATTQYISYRALQRNTVPCSRRGSSYYNCKVGAEANPYARGCSAITQCRG
ncbi:rapid alkalinization factor-like [Quillaja saponaria]|uniref:Rapid alkalinization factor-like n=1 Tax=Quillaja saponaria TaxID=32244 RepID=A0AAD7Q156_QUISA|nr:rapid alkalinization factor-like [Quillaja saponaria]